MPRVHVVGHVQATLYAWTGCYYQLHNFKSEYLWDIAGTAGVLVLWGIFGFIRSTYTFLCYHRLLLIEYCIEQRGKLEVSAKFPFAVCACVLVCLCACAACYLSTRCHLSYLCAVTCVLNRSQRTQ